MNGGASGLGEFARNFQGSLGTVVDAMGYRIWRNFGMIAASAY
jgi:hypothetical protein